jgi:hypothetical protein
MGIIKRFTKFDKCVYWEPDDPTMDELGERKFKAPVEIYCRWEDKVELIQLPSGEEYAAKSTIYVDIELALGGVLWHGLLVSVPLIPPLANLIQQRMSVPNLKNREVVRGVYL